MFEFLFGAALGAATVLLALAYVLKRVGKLTVTVGDMPKVTATIQGGGGPGDVKPPV